VKSGQRGIAPHFAAFVLGEAENEMNPIWLVIAASLQVGAVAASLA